jgi:hypothetical protein
MTTFKSIEIYDQIDLFINTISNEVPFELGDQFRRKFSYAIPDKNTIEALCYFIEEDIILEIGAGRGLWSFLLQEKCKNVIPTDNYIFEVKMLSFDNTFTKIIKMDSVQAVKTFIEANILMSIWPLYLDPMLSNAVKEFKGDKIIFIGESRGGCTGDDEFFEIMMNDWILEKYIKNRVVSYMYDSVFLFKRKK